MAQDLARGAAVASADHQNPFRSPVGEKGDVGDHLVIHEFVSLGDHDDAVVQEHSPQTRSLEDLDVLEEAYFDRTYNIGGADEIADSDLEGTDLTAANLASAMTLVAQLRNFMDNAAVSTGDYHSTVNKVRNRF